MGSVAVGACLAVFLTVLADAQQAPRVEPEAAGLSPTRLQEATDLLSRHVAERRIAGAVAAVARRGRIGYVEAVGVQDVTTRAPMTARSLFRIYSMTRRSPQSR